MKEKKKKKKEREISNNEMAGLQRFFSVGLMQIKRNDQTNPIKLDDHFIFTLFEYLKYLF